MILVEMVRILMMRTRLTMHDVVCKQASSFSSKSQVRAHLLFADCIWTVLTEMPSTWSQF